MSPSVPSRTSSWALVPVLLVFLGVAAGGAGCRKFLTAEKLESFRAARTAAIVWDVENRLTGPDLMRETTVRLLEAAGCRMVDPSETTPDLMVRIALRGSHTYDATKPRDYWMSGEVTWLGPRGKTYERHFYGDTEDLESAFYTEASFYEILLRMIARTFGARIAEEEAAAAGGDSRRAEAARRVLAGLDPASGAD